MKRLLLLFLLSSVIILGQDSTKTVITLDDLKRDQVRLLKIKQSWIMRRDSIIKAHELRLRECVKSIDQADGALWLNGEQLKLLQPKKKAKKEE